MTDIVDGETRSRMMSGIKSKNTKPELTIRKLLHREGFRFRIHVRDLPGQPDIVLKKYKSVIFVHGCFWHGHNCKLFKMPKTREDFWKAKITKNIDNDRKNINLLVKDSWRICIIWECSIRGKKDLSEISQKLQSYLKSNIEFFEVSAPES